MVDAGSLGKQLVQDLHQATHLGVIEIALLLRHRYYDPNLECLIKDTTFRCATHAQINSKVGRKGSGGIRP